MLTRREFLHRTAQAFLVAFVAPQLLTDSTTVASDNASQSRPYGLGDTSVSLDYKISRRGMRFLKEPANTPAKRLNFELYNAALKTVGNELCLTLSDSFKTIPTFPEYLKLSKVLLVST